MKISVIGCGYLGAVHAACMAELGHEVVGVDVDAAKVEALAAGKSPFFEPGLPELLRSNVESGRLRFTTSMDEVAGAEVHFVCVGTPQRKGEYAADLQYVDAAFDSLLPLLSATDVVVGKSTVPVGTAASIAQRLAERGSEAVLVWNPEFLREGFAVKDTLHPDRFVYGVPGGAAGERAVSVLDQVYATPLAAGTPRITSDYATAELVKVAANSFLATKISFINAMAELCEETGADVTKLADAIGYDDRIGRKFLNAGLGFGGGCLPKDIRAFMARAGELGVDQAVAFLKEIDAINERRRSRMVELTREVLDGAVRGKRVAVLGAAFKPNSDDIRDSPAIDVALQLQRQGAVVRITDPEAADNVRRVHPELDVVDSVEKVVDDAEVVLLLTEWAEYRELDPTALGAQVAGRRILDGRNVLDPVQWRAAGWTYRGLGRP